MSHHPWEPMRIRRILPSLLIWLALIAPASAQEPWTELIRYTLDGAGPPVVLIHGIGAGASSAQTRYQIPALVAAGFRVYSIDLPGWGESIGPRRLFTGADYVAAIAEFLDTVVGEPADLVGHSLGGTYAIGVAAAYPERVGRLVLNAPVGALSFTAAADAASVRRWERFVTSMAGQAAYRALGSEPSLQWFCRTSLYVDPGFCTDETIADYRQYTSQPDSIYGAAAFLTGNLGFDARAAFARLDTAPLLIWGDANVFTPLTEAAAFLALNRNARLVVIDAAGALVNHERQVEFDRSMLDQLLAADGI